MRGLAWVAVKWAKAVRPRCIFLENVEEFRTWGPLCEAGQPIAARRGETFEQWCNELRALGYVLEHRTLVAADYGAPTSRKRFFLIARCDGEPIVWPEPTHGPGARTPMAHGGGVHRLVAVRAEHLRAQAPARRRDAAAHRHRDPPLRHRGRAPLHHPGHAPGGPRRVHSVDEPARTVTAAHRGELAVIAPTLVSSYGQSIGRAVDEPAPTVTAGGGGHTALVAPTLIQTGYGSHARGRHLERSISPCRSAPSSRAGASTAW